MNRTPAAAPRAPSLRDLLLRSDFGRLHPDRVDELLDRTADPATEPRGEETSRAAVG